MRPILALLSAAALAAACDSDRPAPAADPAGPRAAADSGADSVAAPADTAPVAVVGRVVDAASGEGIEGATFIVLRAGATWREWEASFGGETEALMEAAVVTDSTGAFRVPAIARGAEYTVLVGASGYRSAIFEGGLAVGLDDPAVHTVSPIALEEGVF